MRINYCKLISEATIEVIGHEAKILISEQLSPNPS
jgi:hypothetical protein